mgnify:CR=1 FL=1
MEEESKTPEQLPRPIPHVLVVGVGGSQHAFEMESREKALELARSSLQHGFVEIENERVYLLAGGPKAGTSFIIMSKSDVMEQQLAAQKAAVQGAARQQQLIRPR